AIANHDDVQSAMSPDASPDADTGALDTGSPLMDTGAPDAGGGVRDASTPDTGARDASSADSGTMVGVECGASKVCSSSAPVCCFFPFGGQLATCAAAVAACEDGMGYACDGDEDCSSGGVCCVSWSTLTSSGFSQCT